MPSHDLAPVPGIDPVDGWSLWTTDYRDGDGFWTPDYYAVRGETCRVLQTSRFFFTPTQDRFAWIVRHGFPSGQHCPTGAIGPLDDDFIDAGIAADETGAKLGVLTALVRRHEPAFHRACASLAVVAGFVGLGLIARAAL